jgi:putative transposase
MARRPRNELPDEGHFHVTSLGVANCDIFRDDHDWAAFRDLLLRAGETFELPYDAWCLMTTHFHIVVAAKRRVVSDALHWLKGMHAQRFNARHERRGHLFENRFAARALESEEHWVNACRYVFDNPVKAGLCERASDWPWSGGRLSGLR